MSSKKSNKRKAGAAKTHQRNTSGLKPPWKPGESGNPKGRPKTLTLSEAYRHKLSDGFPGKKHTWAEEIAERMAKLALRRVAAASELADRTEGKAPQFMQLNGGLRSVEAPIFQVVFASVKDVSATPTDQLAPPAEMKALATVGANHRIKHRSNNSKETGGEL
jgi:hypothetical protein